MACVVGGCKSHSSRKENNSEGLSFHRFPKDDEIKYEWKNRIGRQNWTVKRHSHICSKHFTPDSFICNKVFKWRRLKEDAVPTLFIMDGMGEMGRQNNEEPGTSSTSAHTQPVVDNENRYGGRQAKKRKNDSFHYSTDESVSSVEQARDGSEPAPARPMCCLCLTSAGSETMLEAGLADMLSRCFHITYPAELQATSFVCRECVNMLRGAVNFKKQVLDCLLLLTGCEDTDDFVNMKNVPVELDDDPEALSDDSSSELDGTLDEYDLSIDDSELTTFRHDEPFDANEHLDKPIFTEDTPITEETIIAQTAAKLTPEDQAFFQDGCKCGKNCHKLFTKDEVLDFRRKCEKYQLDVKSATDHADVFLAGALACAAARDEVALKFRDVPVCREFFTYIFALSPEQFDLVLSKVVHRRLHPPSSGSFADQPFAVRFLRDWSTQNCLVLPGRFSNRHPDLHLLPKTATRGSVYSEYARACVAAKKRCVSLVIWEELWEQFCPYIVGRVPRGLCRECSGGEQMHLRLARGEAARARRALRRPAATLHCAVDGLRRLRLARSAAAVLLVARPPPAAAVAYVLPERDAACGSGADVLLSLLHRFLLGVEGDVEFHCGPSLRADRVLQYAAWRGLALAFLPAGHYARPDALARLVRAVRPARCVRDVRRALSAAGVTPLPAPGLALPIYDWRGFFDAARPRPLDDIRNYCHFRADAARPGDVECRLSVGGEVLRVHRVFDDGPPQGEPRLLQPAPDESEVVVQYQPDPAQEHDPLECVKEEVDLYFEEH